MSKNMLSLYGTMKNKGKLKGIQYFIDNDLTQTEVKIQIDLSDLAETEKGNGRAAKVR